jgi:competence ComEA-like helix-hairpin-helix protein
MLSFNHTERKSLATATGLVLLGTAVRLATGPSAADTGWRSLDGTAIESISKPELTSAVEMAIADEKRAGTPLADGEKIDPNFADAIELRRLPGVGPAKAAAIVADRRANGPFRSLEDLERVKGLGRATVESLSPHLELVSMPTVRRPADRRIDLNRAGRAELTALPGIGPALADRIISFRVEQGGFRSVEDLRGVPGIGPATVEKIRNRVRIR